MLRLLMIASVFLIGCSTAPPIDKCISDPPNGLICKEAEGGEHYNLTWDQSANYLCLSPDDYIAAREWLKRQLDRAE